MIFPKPDAEHVAYLTGLYPAVSHTFILREVMALRAAGFRVTTCSVNRPGQEHLIGPEEKAAAKATFYVLDQVRRPLVLLAALGRAAVRPRRLARALSILGQSGVTGIRSHLRQMAYLLEGMVLARFLEDRGVGRLHNQLGMASASVSMYASILAGLPFSFTLHGPDDFFEGATRQMPAKVATADLVACISNFCCNQARQCCRPEDWHKLNIVRCGIDPALYGMTGRTAPVRRILFVGRLVPVKGVSVLLGAFGRIASAFPDAALTIVGDGPERTGLEAAAAALGLGDRVVFTGHLNQEQVAAQMTKSDLFVLPSFAEGLPVVLMEALASGLPVIATRVAGTPELVEDKVTGRIVEAGDEQQLAWAIQECLMDPRTALEMARQGRSRVRERHDMWKEGQRLASMFRANSPTS